MKTLVAFLLLSLPAFAQPPGDVKTDRFRLGIPANSSADKVIEFNKGSGASNPKLKLEGATGKIKVAHDGATFKTLNLGTDIDSGATASGNVLSANGSGGTAWAASLALTGMVFPYAGPSCPTGSILADGTSLNRTTYAGLYAAFGTTWGDSVINRVNPIMTTNSAPSGTASASSVLAAGYEAFRAFDAIGSAGDTNPGNFWLSVIGAAFPQWVQYQFTSAQTIRSYSIAPATGLPPSNLGLAGGCFPAYWATAWALQGSNNGSSWTDLDTRSGQTWTNITTQAGFQKAFVVTTPGSYTYYRLNITAGTSNGCAGAQLYIGIEQLNLSTDTTLGFQVPDMRNRYMRGIGTNGDMLGGDTVLLGQYQIDTFKDHTHGYTAGYDNSNSYPRTWLGAPSQTMATSGATAGSGAETRPKTYGVNYCVIY